MSLIVVSNRLPVTLRHRPEGLSCSESVGGLAMGMRSVRGGDRGKWIGWPGPTHHLSSEQVAEADRLLAEQGCTPVHLTGSEVRGFYQGFSNSVIWPLFHYQIQRLPLHPREWSTYDNVNRRFAERIAECWSPGDEVWIHDYHLFRVPLHLRELCPAAPIGLFLHIPFPAFEIFRTLPARRLVLEGMLGADLIGFHTESYADHFTNSVQRLLELPLLDQQYFDCSGRRAAVGVFPMGVEVTRFEAAAGGGMFGPLHPAASSVTPVKLLVGIDRLDYTKGIPRRLRAFQQLLQQHPELHEKVSLLQVAVPSRTGVRAYDRFRKQVDALVGRINGMYGTAGWTPIQYLYRRFSQADLIGLYRRADVLVVTPVRDGMNLVAKEFVASRVDGDGVLLLSEFAGAASELTEAVSVNPYDIDETAAAYYQALTMQRSERRARMRALRIRVRSTPVDRWAASFLATLRAVRPVTPPVSHEPSPPNLVASALARLAAAPALLLLLDYDGTLRSFTGTPGEASPDRDLLQLLGQLAERRGTEVHVVSGRSRLDLETWFGNLPIGLHAEHGSWSRDPSGDNWVGNQSLHPVPYDELLGVLKRHASATTGAVIERKSAGLAWHYRLACPAAGPRNADALIEEVSRNFPKEHVDVLRGKQVVEFRPNGINKGLVVTRLLDRMDQPVLTAAIGDDNTDEEMFAVLPPNGLSVCVGTQTSNAQLRLPDVASCREFLRGLMDSPCRRLPLAG